MREIKFRAWDGKVMRYDNILIDGSNGHVIGSPILMQFTGLKDREGKEIWEGDVLSSCPIGYIPETRKPGELGEVVWIEPKKGYHEDPSHGWKIKSKTGLTNITVWLHVTGCGYEEVLGNIHENPELLK